MNLRKLQIEFVELVQNDDNGVVKRKDVNCSAQFL